MYFRIKNVSEYLHGQIFRKLGAQGSQEVPLLEVSQGVRQRFPPPVWIRKLDGASLNDECVHVRDLQPFPENFDPSFAVKKEAQLFLPRPRVCSPLNRLPGNVQFTRLGHDCTDEVVVPLRLFPKQVLVQLWFRREGLDERFHFGVAFTS